ncbi:MAG: sigma factor-like helix-turn-helix DNA-binding protein, partial [Polyangiaceae bacterium]
LCAEPPPSPGDAEADVDARRRAAHVTRALASLPEVHREIVLLFFDEGLTTEDVATILDLRPDAVRKRLSRARAELARLLDLSEHGGSDI